jgi:hypothetical protein
MKQGIVMGLYLISLSAFSQENTVAAGNTASGGNGSATYSLGQIVYEQQDGSSGSLNQGVQQPYELFTVSIVETTLLNLTVYPNPSVQQVTLSLGELPTSPYTYALIDYQGRMIQSDEISEQHTQIDLTECAKATYLLRIMDKQTIVSVIEIIKN